MSDLTTPESRRRSRSKTPFVLRSQCDKENCTETDHIHGHTKKAPAVETIVEEGNDANTNNRTQTRTTRKAAAASTVVASTAVPSTDSTVAKTVQQSSSKQSVAESRNSSSATTTTVITTSSVTHTGKTTKKTSAAESAASSTQRAASLSKEQSQNEQNAMFEESTVIGHSSSMQTSTPINNTKRQIMHSSTLVTSPISAAGSVSIDDHAAYREYRDAGEYWNKFPKTDYTYSKLSPHRRELAPGIIAMPNMSRRSLDHHHNRVDQMAQANPDQESYIRTRYQARQLAAKNRRHESLYDSLDSQDELDVVSYRNSRTTRTSTSLVQRIIFVRWITTVVSWFWETITSSFRSRKDTDFYYTRMEEKQGWLRRFGAAISSSVWSVVRFIYLTVSSVLFLDSWLLMRKSSGSKAKKRFLLLLLILLPFLLLAAWRLREENSDGIAVPFRLPAISLGLPFTMAALPGFDFFKLNWLWSSSLTPPPPQDPSLTDAQYRDLLSHLSRYVESLVDQKVATSEQKLSETIIVNIAKTVNEHITNNQYVLSDVDVDRIADKVRLQLVNERSANEAPFVFKNEHVVHVSNLVKEHLSANPIVDNSAPQLDVETILLQILSSPKLTEIIDQRVLVQTQPDSQLIVEQQKLIEALRGEINSIKIKLDQNIDSGINVKQTIVSLQSQQENLENTFKEFSSDYGQRLVDLLRDVDAKILSAGEKQLTALDAHIKVLLMDIMGYTSAAGEIPDKTDLKAWIQNVFVAKDVLEAHLQGVRVQSDARLQEEIDRSAGVLMQNIGDQIREQTIVMIERNNIEVLGMGEGSGSIGRKTVNLNVEEIRRIVKEALAVYDADKTGLVDYALESAGGEIISTRCTETYHTKTAQISIFGIPLWYPSNTPRTAISPTVQPGQCWAFQGFPGFLVLKLNTYIHVTGFTIEHIPKSLSPNGQIDSAPKTFTVWGLESEADYEPLQFGTYEFVDDDISNLQYFPVQASDIQRLHNIVELRIESNHGNTNYSCLYRFRVHGTPESG